MKQKLLKAASICLYIFSGLWFVAAGCAFALSDYIYWLFAVLALVSLYDGFVVTSVREDLEEGKGDSIRTKFLVSWIVSIVALPAFVLNAIAYFNKNNEVVARKTQIVSESKDAEKPAKPFYKSRSFITMCVSFVLIFVLGFSGMAFETSGFSVKVSDFTLTQEMTMMYNNGEINGEQYVMENDTSYAVTMYVPSTATEESPAPTVFVIPGFTRTKATMAQYCIELSRRGAVVFCIDPGSQGSTTETSTDGANGAEYLVQYVYNNTDDFNFCDKDRFGIIGHSAGGGNATTVASDMAGDSYETSVIKALFSSGYIKVSAAAKYKNLNCNAALSYAYYDEGAFRYQTDTTAFEVIALRFLNDVKGQDTNNYPTYEIDKAYGNMEDGTYRIIHREMTNHCFEMYDKASIANSIEFFNSTLNMGSTIDANNQIWFGKELSTGLAMAAAFTFIISLCAVLLKTPFFATMKVANSKVSQVEVSEIGTTQPRKTVVSKVVLWTSMILTAIIACLDYIPLANWSIEIFPTGNFASVYTFVFPARMVNAILLWATINGAIGLVIFFGTTLVENWIVKIKAKKNGTVANCDWSKFNAIKICGDSGKAVLFNVLKMLLLSVILIVAFFFMTQLSYWLFHQDFRFMLISAAPVNARMFVTAIEYIPLIFVFYISNSIRVNCSVGREGWKEWKVMLVGALANSLGLAFILLINYVCYFTTGSPYYGYWGNGTEVWLYVNMVFGLVVMMFLLPIFNRLLYKMSGNVWLGAIVWSAIFVTMTICASVSYIPM